MAERYPGKHVPLQTWKLTARNHEGGVVLFSKGYLARPDAEADRLITRPDIGSVACEKE